MNDNPNDQAGERIRQQIIDDITESEVEGEGAIQWFVIAGAVMLFILVAVFTGLYLGWVPGE